MTYRSVKVLFLEDSIGYQKGDTMIAVENSTGVFTVRRADEAVVLEDGTFEVVEVLKSETCTTYLPPANIPKANLRPSEPIYQNAWQRCPVCNGSGVGHYAVFSTHSEPPPCRTCNGRTIISTLTGLPPTSAL